MTPVLAAARPCFAAIAQTRQLDPGALSSPEAVAQKLRGFIDEMRAKLGAARVSPQDVQDVTYAVVALTDEVAVNAGEPLSAYWTANLLQFHYFRENTAGEGFFDRLAALRSQAQGGAQREGRREILQVYALCLVFGFQGKYRVRGAQLDLLTLTDAVQREAGLAAGAQSAAMDVELSPHAEHPVPALARARQSLPFLAAAGGALALAALLYLGERFSLGREISGLEADVAALPRP